MPIYDSHTHPNLKPLSQKAKEVMEEAKENDLYLNVVGVDVPSSWDAVELAKQYPGSVKACVALHPNDVQKNSFERTKKELDRICLQNIDHIGAIGECGLDFHYTKRFVDEQYRFLKMHLDLAEKYRLPIMFHVRDAHDEIIAFIKEQGIGMPIVIHCFSEDRATALRFVELRKGFDVYLSIPGIVTFKNAAGLRDAIGAIPLSMMLVETDAPWLAPMPHRGKENRPVYVKHTIGEIASLKGVAYEEVAKATFDNAVRIFRSR